MESVDDGTLRAFTLERFLSLNRQPGVYDYNLRLIRTWEESRLQEPYDADSLRAAYGLYFERRLWFESERQSITLIRM